MTYRIRELQVFIGSTIRMARKLSLERAGTLHIICKGYGIRVPKLFAFAELAAEVGSPQAYQTLCPELLPFYGKPRKSSAKNI